MGVNNDIYGTKCSYFGGGILGHYATRETENRDIHFQFNTNYQCHLMKLYAPKSSLLGTFNHPAIAKCQGGHPKVCVNNGKCMPGCPVGTFHLVNIIKSKKF